MKSSQMREARVARWCFLGWATLLVVLLVHAAGVRVNLSQSMPKGLYWFYDCGESAAERAAVGDVVAVDVAKASQESEAFRFFLDRRYLSATGARSDVLLKRVAARQGDRIDVRAGRVTVNGERLSEAASTRISVAHGEAIPRVPVPATIPARHVWLTCDHPRGIDSRYFGPIRTRAIRCLAEPLWLF